jgi:molybdate transport system permease protein
MSESEDYRPPSDTPFFVCLGLLSGGYILIIVCMILADSTFTTPGHLLAALNAPEIRYATKLSLVSCTITTILSLWVAVPIGYLMSRYQFRGKTFVDAMLDIPIVLPPLVIGLSLLILFTTSAGKAVERMFESFMDSSGLARTMGIKSITYDIPSVIIAQFMVACAFAVRTMRVTFDQIPVRQEHVALTLGCSQSQSFWMVVFPQARRGLLTAATLAWARALGEFGPILVFSGATRFKTEVLPTTIFLEMSIGNIEAAVAVSLLMIFIAIVVLIVVRTFGLDSRIEGKALR